MSTLTSQLEPRIKEMMFLSAARFVSVGAVGNALKDRQAMLNLGYDKEIQLSPDEQAYLLVENSLIHREENRNPAFSLSDLLTMVFDVTKSCLEDVTRSPTVAVREHALMTQRSFDASIIRLVSVSARAQIEKEVSVMMLLGETAPDFIWRQKNPDEQVLQAAKVFHTLYNRLPKQGDVLKAGPGVEDSLVFFPVGSCYLNHRSGTTYREAIAIQLAKYGWHLSAGGVKRIARKVRKISRGLNAQSHLFTSHSQKTKTTQPCEHAHTRTRANIHIPLYAKPINSSILTKFHTYEY